MMMLRKKVVARAMAAMLQRRAVRILWLGPDAAPLDPRIEEAKRRGDAQPMPADLLNAVKAVVEIVPGKESLWTAIKKDADAQMSKLWDKIKSTPRWKEFETIKSELEHRKQRLDAAGRQLEDGVFRKLSMGNRQFVYLKTHVVKTSEEQIQAAMREVEQARAVLEQAKEKLAALKKSKEESVERVNVLLIEELRRTPQPEAKHIPLTWRRKGSYETITQAIMDAEAVDELALEPLEEIDAALDGFLAALEELVQAEASEEDVQALAPETEEQPAEATSY